MQKFILFDERLSLLRKQAGISQKQLGEVIGLSNKAICTMENGTRETTFEKLVLLAEFFHVSTDYLLGVTDDPTWRGDGGEQSPPPGAALRFPTPPHTGDHSNKQASPD